MAEGIEQRLTGAAMTPHGRKIFTIEDGVFRSKAKVLETLDGMEAWAAIVVLVEAGNAICSLSLEKVEWKPRRP